MFNIFLKQNLINLIIKNRNYYNDDEIIFSDQFKRFSSFSRLFTFQASSKFSNIFYYITSVM